jgi:peroxiredoxin
VTTTDQTIAERVSTLKADLAEQAPAELLAAFTDEQAVLGAAGVPAGVLTAGMPMPDGKLLDVDGEPTTLAEARGDQRAVVVFYRGAWCPYCNLTLRAYEEQLVPTLNGLGVRLIAISPQKPDGALTMRESNRLTYTVLSDPGNQIAGRLGILNPPRSAAARAAALALGSDVAATNGDGTDTVPMPTTVIVDTDGTIRWIDVHPDYTTRTEAHEIIASL